MVGVMRWDKVIKDCGFVSVVSGHLLRGGIRRSCYETLKKFYGEMHVARYSEPF